MDGPLNYKIIAQAIKESIKAKNFLFRSPETTKKFASRNAYERKIPQPFTLWITKLSRGTKMYGIVTIKVSI